MNKKENSSTHIENVEKVDNTNDSVVGTVKLINETEIVLVPTPTNDPSGKRDCVKQERCLTLTV